MAQAGSAAKRASGRKSASSRERWETLFAVHAKASGIDLEPQFRWHPERKFRADFAHLAQRILVEIEGGAWIGGRHTSGSGFVADARKHALAQQLGWRVLRIVPEMVRDGSGLECLIAMLDQRNTA